MKVVQEGEADFLIKNVSGLKYGLHFSTVISRRDPLAGGAIEVLKKMYMCKKSSLLLPWAAFFNCNFEKGPALREVPSKLVKFSDIRKQNTLYFPNR